MWQTHDDVSETAAASIIMVYTQEGTVQHAYTGTETDLIFVVSGRFRFIQLGSLLTYLLHGAESFLRS
jgi:hypothetical protein